MIFLELVIYNSVPVIIIIQCTVAKDANFMIVQVDAICKIL